MPNTGRRINQDVKAFFSCSVNPRVFVAFLTEAQSSPFTSDVWSAKFALLLFYLIWFLSSGPLNCAYMNKATKLLCSNFYISVKTENLLDFWKPRVAACADRINRTQNLKSRLYSSHRSGRIAPFVRFYFLRVEAWSNFTRHNGTELWENWAEVPEEMTWMRDHRFMMTSGLFFLYVTQLPSQAINRLYVKDVHKQWSAHLWRVELTDFTVSAFRKQTWCKTMDFCTDFRTSCPSVTDGTKISKINFLFSSVRPEP